MKCSDFILAHFDAFLNPRAGPSHYPVLALLSPSMAAVTAYEKE
jgi:hypothetical protein